MATTAIRSIAERTKPALAANVDPKAILAKMAGTATPARGTASKFDNIPIGATLPNASAVIGAVASVAPHETANNLVRPAWRDRDHPTAHTVPPTAAIDNHAPTELTALGSSVHTTSAATARTADGGGLRWRDRPTA